MKKLICFLEAKRMLILRKEKQELKEKVSENMVRLLDLNDNQKENNF